MDMSGKGTAAPSKHTNATGDEYLRSWVRRSKPMEISRPSTEWPREASACVRLPVPQPRSKTAADAGRWSRASITSRSRTPARYRFFSPSLSFGSMTEASRGRSERLSQYSLCRATAPPDNPVCDHRHGDQGDLRERQNQPHQCRVTHEFA